MFEKIGDAAERLAVRVSRRQFFGWAGKSALAVAGLLAFGSAAHAGCPLGTTPCGPGRCCDRRLSNCCGCGCCPKNIRADYTFL